MGIFLVLNNIHSHRSINILEQISFHTTWLTRDTAQTKFLPPGKMFPIPLRDIPQRGSSEAAVQGLVCTLIMSWPIIKSAEPFFFTINLQVIHSVARYDLRKRKIWAPPCTAYLGPWALAVPYPVFTTTILWWTGDGSDLFYGWMLVEMTKPNVWLVVQTTWSFDVLRSDTSSLPMPNSTLRAH